MAPNQDSDARRRRLQQTFTYSVSGGNFNSPYFTYSPSLPSTLEAGNTYVFQASGISSNHPFGVGTARYVTPAWITGATAGLTGSGSTITVAVPSDYTGDIAFYCHYHGSMTITRSVAGGSTPVSSSLPPPSPPPNPPPPHPSSPPPEPEPEPEPEPTTAHYSAPHVDFAHTGAPLQSLSSAGGFGEAQTLCTQNAACHAVVEDQFPNAALSQYGMRYVLRGQGALQASVGSRTVLKHEGGNPPPPPLSPPPPSATVTAATTHSHAFGGVTYHMPDGFPGAQHGESGCPAHATLLSPKAPPPPPPPPPKAPPPPPSPKAPPPPPPPRRRRRRPIAR